MHARQLGQALPPRPATHQRQGLRRPRQPRRDQRGPLLPLTYDHPHDGHTVTQHYGRHTISDNDQPLHDLDDLDDVVAVQHLVADSLDYPCDANEHNRVSLRYWHDPAIRSSAARIVAAVVKHDNLARLVARLSPEERAEFDRRTT